MDKERKGRSRPVRILIGVALGIVILFAVLVGARVRWIRPVPGVSLDMRLPPVTEADLGTDSAYQLLLEAVKTPDGMKQLHDGGKWRATWGQGHAYGKLLHHPWPAEPPPALEEWVMDLQLQDSIRLTGKDAGSAPPVLDDLLAAPEKRILTEEGPWTREQYEYVLKIVELYEPNIPLLNRALAAPNPQMPTIQTLEQMLPYLSPARGLARELVVVAAVKVGDGDIAEGFGLLVKTARLGNLVSRGAGTLNYLISGTCAAMATKVAVLLAQRHDIPAEVLKRTARDLLACADDAEPYAEVVRAEAYAGIHTVDLYYDKLPAKLAKAQFSNAERLALYRPLQFLMRSNPTETKRNIAACYQQLVAQEEKASTPGSARTYAATLDEALTKNRSKAEILLRVRDPLGIAYANQALEDFTKDRTRAKISDARIRAVALFLAVAAYAKEKGQPPPDLNALVPDYLPHLPIDPFSGKSFLYLPTGVPSLPDDAWAIYSVGTDGKDDGGKGTSIGKAWYTGPPPNVDLVWPSQPHPKASDLDLGPY